MSTRRLAGVGLAVALAVLAVLLFTVGETTSALCAMASAFCWITILAGRAGRRRARDGHQRVGREASVRGRRPGRPTAPRD